MGAAPDPLTSLLTKEQLREHQLSQAQAAAQPAAGGRRADLQQRLQAKEAAERRRAAAERARVVRAPRGPGLCCGK